MNDKPDDTADVIIPHQSEIAVSMNADGDLVLKQAGQYGPEEDSSIHVAPVNVERLVKAMLRTSGSDWTIVPWTSVVVINDGGEMLSPFPDIATVRKFGAMEAEAARRDRSECSRGRRFAPARETAKEQK